MISCRKKSCHVVARRSAVRVCAAFGDVPALKNLCLRKARKTRAGCMFN